MCKPLEEITDWLNESRYTHAHTHIHIHNVLVLCFVEITSSTSVRADFIIDVLSNERYRNTIMNHYQKTTEVANMKNAIEIGRDMARDHTSDVGIMP